MLNAQDISPAPVHPWLRTVHVAHVPGPSTALLDGFVPRLLQALRDLGHDAQESPNAHTDLILTTAPFAEPLNWRQAESSVSSRARPRLVSS